MNNPLDLPRKTHDSLKDAEDLARDLAYGALHNEWSPYIDAMQDGSWLVSFGKKSITPMQERFMQKWGLDVSRRPSFALLEVLGYLAIQKDHRASITGGYVEIAYRLTLKAFDLLKQPTESPRVFISYRRSESSALALLIEARLRMAGADPNRIFVDKNIPGGADWEKMIRSRAENCDFLIALIAPTTLESPYVRQEITWAADRERVIIPVCHNGMTLDACDPSIQIYHGHDIDEDAPSAMKYETAVNFILSSVGYPTY